jgi:hypothetical protein
MPGRLLFAAALFAALSFTPALAEDVSTITPAPPQRTPSHHDLAELVNRQAAASTPLPLTQYQYPYSQLPYKVNPYAVGRGPQSGYNQCNSTTEGPTSQCQTLIVNNITDFCLWGSPTANGQIGDIEAAVVAYCAQTGHGSRIMPPGTLTGVQVRFYADVLAHNALYIITVYEDERLHPNHRPPQPTWRWSLGQ